MISNTNHWVIITRTNLSKSCLNCAKGINPEGLVCWSWWLTLACRGAEARVRLGLGSASRSMDKSLSDVLNDLSNPHQRLDNFILSMSQCMPYACKGYHLRPLCFNLEATVTMMRTAFPPIWNPLALLHEQLTKVGAALEYRKGRFRAVKRGSEVSKRITFHGCDKHVKSCEA